MGVPSRRVRRRSWSARAPCRATSISSAAPIAVPESFFTGQTTISIPGRAAASRLSATQFKNTPPDTRSVAGRCAATRRRTSSSRYSSVMRLDGVGLCRPREEVPVAEAGPSILSRRTSVFGEKQREAVSECPRKGSKASASNARSHRSRSRVKSLSRRRPASLLAVSAAGERHEVAGASLRPGKPNASGGALIKEADGLFEGARRSTFRGWHEAAAADSAR